MIDIAVLGGLGLLSVVAVVLIVMSLRPRANNPGRRRQQMDTYVPQRVDTYVPQRREDLV
jgi:hypothetical protein